MNDSIWKTVQENVELKKQVAEQKAEIENLQADKEALISGQETLQKCIAEKTAEIERLKETPISQNTIDGFKADVIKEFAERLKEQMIFEGISALNGKFNSKKFTDYDIDNLVKEMTEGGERK